jgi:hypothetical protein
MNGLSVRTAEWVTDIVMSESVSAADDIENIDQSVCLSLSLSITATFNYNLLYLNGRVVKESSRSVSNLFHCAYGYILMFGISLLHNISYM